MVGSGRSILLLQSSGVDGLRSAECHIFVLAADSIHLGILHQKILGCGEPFVPDVTAVGTGHDLEAGVLGNGLLEALLPQLRPVGAGGPENLDDGALPLSCWAMYWQAR
jgi:hypothetical protein